MRRIAVALLLVLYPINLGFLDRKGYDFGALSLKFNYSDYILLLLLLYGVLNYKNVSRLMGCVPHMHKIILSVLFVTFTAYLFVVLSGFGVPFSVEGRLLVQLLAYLSSIAAGLIVADFFVIKPLLVKKWLFIGLSVVLLSGLLQIMIQGFGGILKERLYGIAGEPKGFALYLIPFIVAFSMAKERNYPVLIFLVSCLLLTQSATAFLAVIFLYICIAFIFDDGGDKIKSVLFLGALFFIVLLSGDHIYGMLVDRVFERVTAVDTYRSGVLEVVQMPIIGDILVEGNEAPFIRLMLGNPLFCFTGFGYGMGTVFAFPYFLRYGGGFLSDDYVGYITPNLGLVNNVANYGLIVIGVMVFSLVRICRRVKARDLDKHYLFLFYYLLASFLVTLVFFEIHFKLIFLYVLLMIYGRYLMGVSMRGYRPKTSHIAP